MDTPLPCDVKIGNGIHRKGTSLRTLVNRAQRLHEAAFGPAPTKEEAAANLEQLRSAVIAPAQASAVDERDRKDAERYRWLREQMLGVDFDWDESGKTALCFEMPDGCSFAADCDQVIDDASAALAQKGGK